MATQEQIQSNRRNCRLGTGPTTPPGKAAVRRIAAQDEV
jgi:hypothetical protein